MAADRMSFKDKEVHLGNVYKEFNQFLDENNPKKQLNLKHAHLDDYIEHLLASKQTKDQARITKLQAMFQEEIKSNAQKLIQTEKDIKNGKRLLLGTILLFAALTVFTVLTAAAILPFELLLLAVFFDMFGVSALFASIMTLRITYSDQKRLKQDNTTCEARMARINQVKPPLVQLDQSPVRPLPSSPLVITQGLDLKETVSRVSDLSHSSQKGDSAEKAAREHPHTPSSKTTVSFHSSRSRHDDHQRRERSDNTTVAQSSRQRGFHPTGGDGDA